MRENLQESQVKDPLTSTLSPQAALAYFAYAKYRQGITDFEQDYRDPANDHTTPYPPAPYDSGPTGYQQSPYSHNQQQPGEYQPPSY